MTGEHEGPAGASSSGAAASAPCLPLATGCPRTLPPPRGHLYKTGSSSVAFLQPASPMTHLPRYLRARQGCGAPGQGAGLGRPEPGAQGFPLLNFWRCRAPQRAGSATPGSARSSGSWADGPRDLQPDKQTPVQLELKLKEAGGQCPPRGMGEESPLAEGAQLAPEAVCWGWEEGGQGGGGSVCVCRSQFLCIPRIYSGACSCV